MFSLGCGINATEEEQLKFLRKTMDKSRKDGYTTIMYQGDPILEGNSSKLFEEGYMCKCIGSYREKGHTCYRYRLDFNKKIVIRSRDKNGEVTSYIIYNKNELDENL